MAAAGFLSILAAIERASHKPVNALGQGYGDFFWLIFATVKVARGEG